MQPNPLLEKLDWIFTSNAWTLKYPDTSAKALNRSPSDHCPCLVQISTQIPKPKAFRFENYWLQMQNFQEILSSSWNSPLAQLDPARTLTAKYKRLRKTLKEKQASLSNLKTVIQNVKNIIQFLDVIEEYRDLSLPEWNFRSSLKEKLFMLLDQQKTYWKQRGNIKWVKLGDATTKFFHANATIRMRGNLIRHLEREDGYLASTHREKEEMLWKEYKERLGKSEFDRFGFELEYLLQTRDDLSCLELPLSNHEIEAVIKYLPNDKSPGPDGFTNEFLKASWGTVKEDLLKFCDSFFSNEVCLRSINTSFITLVPKVHDPRTVTDFRPISLLNSSLKLLTKIMANRLQPVITKLVHKNQYGFIKHRTIQDCVAWAFEYLHMCHHSKKEIVVIKLDFEKAFDKMEHQAIIKILQAKGFGERWIGWVRALFTSATSQVLLNGSPGKTIHCLRGVRQGDPLSPLLFVLAADLLQSLINKGKDLGLLSLPIPLQTNPDFPVVQYADDTLIILEGDTRQLLFLKSVINTFSEATGLKVNLKKSMMLPININDQKLDHLANTFGCSKGSFPFTYLGLPLGLTKPVIQDYLPLINKCESRLGGVSALLSQAGRLEITNAVMTALPTFYLCSLEIPGTVIKRIDSFRKNCLWRGSDVNGRKPPQAAWTLVCQPKEQGGLGVIDLGKQNKALMMKNWDKFLNKRDIPWVQMIWEKYYRNDKLPGRTRKGSFWWRDNLKLLHQYKEFASIALRNGESTLFWEDKWNNRELKATMPELFSFTKKQYISAKKVLECSNLSQLFHLPLSVQAYQQLQQLLVILQRFPHTQEKDVWSYTWGERFHSNRAYKLLMGHSQIHDSYKWLWKSKCQPKHKVFFWLLLKDRLNTRNILRRKNMELASFDCVFCVNSTEETAQHLFLQCPFAGQCWDSIQIEAPMNTNFPEAVSQIKDQIQSSFFMETIILMSWSIWKTRNNQIFEGIPPSIGSAKLLFRKELLLLTHRVKDQHLQVLEAWIQSLS